jgi:hypothetical protein
LLSAIDPKKPQTPASAHARGSSQARQGLMLEPFADRPLASNSCDAAVTWRKLPRGTSSEAVADGSSFQTGSSHLSGQSPRSSG